MGNRKEKLCSLSNEQLVSLTQNGDVDARNVLTSRFFYKSGKSFPSSYMDSDDLLQEGMLGFLKAVDTYDASKGVPFEAYALVCIRNKMRTAAKFNDFEVPVGDSSDLVEDASGSLDPLEKIIVDEHLSQVLDSCEETLSSVEKAVVFLRAVGMSYDEIGERVGMVPKSVDNALQRARRKLKICIDE